MEKYPKVAIVYLAYHPDDYIDRFVEAVKNIVYPKEQIEILIVENKHPDFELSLELIENKILDLSEKNFPHITYLPQKDNLGFSKGVNKGISWALEHNFEYMYLHNQDGFMHPECLKQLVEVLEGDLTIGAAQSLLLCYPDTNVINSSGNSLHYLGFGFVNDLGKKNDSNALSNIQDIGYASGASVLLRGSLLKKYGLWDENFFFYHEDIEYSLRLKTLGYRIVVVNDSIFYHHYEFGRHKNKYFLVEQNRLGILLMFFKLPTLLLLVPIGIVAELGILLFSIKNKWWKEKLRVYVYWFRFKTLKCWLKKRFVLQNQRIVGDKKLLKGMVGKIIFADKSVDNKLLRLVGNPIIGAYLFLLKKIIFW
jgi:GT2 family glycosyltransferase